MPVDTIAEDIFFADDLYTESEKPRGRLLCMQANLIRAFRDLESHLGC